MVTGAEEFAPMTSAMISNFVTPTTSIAEFPAPTALQLEFMMGILVFWAKL